MIYNLKIHSILNVPHRLTENPIQETMRNRILELLPLGVGKIWVKATAYDDFHIANILGIDIESWEEVLPYSNLARANGSLKLSEWGKKLHLNVEIRRYNNSSEKTNWFRFTKAIDVNDNVRGKRRRDEGLEAHQPEEVESEDENSAQPQSLASKHKNVLLSDSSRPLEQSC